MTSKRGTRQEDTWLASILAGHGQELRGYLARFAESAADIDDWMQESLLRLYAASREKELQEPRAYLFRVARNVALTRLEHRRVRHAARFDVEQAHRVRTESPPMHRLAQRDQDVRLLRRAIESLPERCREAFVLCKIHGFSHGEIAGILNISVSTVEKHLVKGLRLCRNMLVGTAAAVQPAAEGADTESPAVREGIA